MTFRPLILFLLLSLIYSCGDTLMVDSIYHNGSILTMESEEKISAVSIKDGKIYSVGDFETLGELAGADTEIIDLNGKTMLPGFIDAHSHFSMAMRIATRTDLSSPPVGDVSSISDIVKKLKTRRDSRNISKGEWIVGWGYDQDQLEESRHPNRYDLDEEFPDHPVYLLHASGHMSVVNSKALEILGLTQESNDPQGGKIIRMPNSREPSGLLQEAASAVAGNALPQPTQGELDSLLEEVQNLYASHGITTAQDGLLDPNAFNFLEESGKSGHLKIDIEVLASFQHAEKWLTTYKDRFGKNVNGLKLTGIKIVSDGSPQGKTAFFSQPYLTDVPGCTHSCKGISTVTQEQLDQLIKITYNHGIQTYVHCNGDGSIDMLLEAHEKNKDEWKGDNSGPRTVVIHSQFVRNDQLDKYAEYGFVPSFFTNHAFFWGDVHMDNLGQERANFLSPLKTAISKGIVATNHTDYIVTPLSQLFLVSTAVNRKSRSGRVVGPNERISPLEALKAITINAAYQHRVEDIKGSIKVGKLADFVILNQNPLEVANDKIQDIKVLKTIKEGKVIYEAN